MPSARHLSFVFVAAAAAAACHRAAGRRGPHHQAQGASLRRATAYRP